METQRENSLNNQREILEPENHSLNFWKSMDVKEMKNEHGVQWNVSQAICY